MFAKFPCQNCPDRWYANSKTCHSSCKRYLDYKSEYDKEKARIRQEQDFYIYVHNKSLAEEKRKNTRIRKRSSSRYFKGKG